MKIPKFPSTGALSRYAAGQRQLSKICEDQKVLVETGDSEQDKISHLFLTALRSATVKGFPSTKEPIVQVEIGGNQPVLLENVFDSMISRQANRKEGLPLTYEDFLGLSVRERGNAWEHIRLVLEGLIEAGYCVVEIRITMKDGFIDRSWDYPATITIMKK